MMRTVTVTFSQVRAKSRPWPDATCEEEREKKSYDYLYDGGEALERGDVVVVAVGEGQLVSSMRVVRVTDVIEGRSSAATKHVVCRVDVSSYLARLNRAAERELILAELEARQKKLDETSRFGELALSDPEAAILLERLKSLS